MDQDFHYYGSYYAARCGGFSKADAALIAKSANFIDFFNESTYASYWKLVSETEFSSSYNVLAEVDNPRYTYQGNIFGSAIAPEDGLWCSYHFIPGNYNDPAGAPTREDVHGADAANYLPDFLKRDTSGGLKILKKYNPGMVDDLQLGRMLCRPQSALSRQLILDAIHCATSDERLEKIIGYAAGGEEILKKDRSDALRRFRLILLGVRAHVIADTWAHQDHCGISNVMNTYWDSDYDPDSWNPSKMGYGRQSIQYCDGSFSDWKNRVLSSSESVGKGNRNFEAAPNGTSYLGHGWLGHFPDYSFVKFRYKPCWSDPKRIIERDNQTEYAAAWVELVSLFNQANGKGKLKLENINSDLRMANEAIRSPCDLESGNPGRKSSEEAWLKAFPEEPQPKINVSLEPDKEAILNGMIQISKEHHRYGTSYINIQSDLYLFLIAADYHFHFIKNYLKKNDIYTFTGSWSQQRSALSNEVSNLF